MAIDTTEFDAEIAKAQSIVDEKQAVLSQHQLFVMQQEVAILGADVRAAQNTVDELINKRNKYIAAKEEEERKKKEAEDLKDSVKP